MKITTVSKEEWKKEYLEKTDIKEMIYEFQSGVLKDMEILKKMMNSLHAEIKALSERIEKYETDSKAKTENITGHNKRSAAGRRWHRRIYKSRSRR